MTRVRGLWCAVLCLASACGLTLDDNEDGGGPGSSGGNLPTVGFATDVSFADETVDLVEVHVVLSKPSSELVSVAVTYSGTATQGEDYHGDQMVVLLPGVTATSLVLRVAGDSIPEEAETIEITLSAATGARLDGSRHTFTIRENLMPRVTFAMSGQSDDEFDTTARVRVLVMPVSSVPISVGYTLGGNASYADYTLRPATLTIPAGETSVELPIGHVNDALSEVHEELIITLVDPVNAILGEFPAFTHGIIDNDAPVNAVFADDAMTFAEGDTGSKLVTVEVRLDGVSGQRVEVPFAPLAGSTTATEGSDFTITTPSPLVFEEGVTSQSLTIALHGDTILDGSERLVLQLHGGITHGVDWPYELWITIDNDECHGTGTFRVCPDQVSTAALTLSGIVSTDSAPCASKQPPGWIEAGQLPACFIVAGDVTVTNVRATGYRPLVLLANTITVTTLLDAGSHQGTYGYGAGTLTQPTTCEAFAGTPSNNAGGAGGSFSTLGGAGGNHAAPAGSGGLPAPAVGLPTTLRSGCRGQTAEFSGGQGSGGGAVYLLAVDSITLAPGSTINASGAPGLGGSLARGGHGGGSGGMIVLSAPSIQASSARVVANGGGGGEGSHHTTDGVDGSEPDPANPFSPAAGGSGTFGGDGGAGAVQGVAAVSGESTNNDRGGGGGGGGLGYILTSQPLTGATCSPSPVAF